MANEKEIKEVIEEGMIFKKSSQKPRQVAKVKTKAKKKAYITGAHGSASAKKKADIRERRANRHK